MGDDSEDYELEGYVSELLAPPIDCGVKIRAKTYMRRINIPEGHEHYPPGDYVSAHTTITVKVGDLEPLMWGLLPVSYWGLESSSEWENVRAGWREQFHSISQSIVQRIPDILTPVVESAVKEVEINYVDFESNADGSVKIKRGPKKKNVATTDSSRSRWSQFIAALPEYRAKWQKARDSKNERGELPEDLVKAIDERLPNKRHKYKPYQVALVHLAREFKVLGLGSEFLRVGSWKTIERELEKFQSLMGDK